MHRLLSFIPWVATLNLVMFSYEIESFTEYDSSLTT